MSLHFFGELLFSLAGKAFSLAALFALWGR
jgi:hypothetical protein